MEKFDEAMNKLNEMSENLKKDREAFDAQQRAFEQERAAYKANPSQAQETETRAAFESIKQAMLEKRAITLGGTGAVAVLNVLEKAFQNKTSILDGVQFHYGPNSNTIIPILNPRPAVPARAAEGATNISADSTGALGAAELKPETYVSVLPVSFEALKYSGANLEAELTQALGEGFRQAMLNGMINGRGKATYYEMGGLFGVTGTAVNCAASGAPTMGDIVALALRMADLDMAEPCIVISPTLYAGVTASAGAGLDVYKEELIRNKSIEGVKVEISGKAPSTTSASAVVAVGYDKAQYHIGVAADLTIEPIKKVGDTNTYYQACMGLDGKPAIDANVYQLTAV